MTQAEIDALKRKSGMYRQAYIVVETDPATNEIVLLSGQTGLSETLTNNLAEVTPVKTAGVSVQKGAGWVTRSNGTRDYTASITVSEMNNEESAKAKIAMLEKLKTSQDTGTHVLIGDLQAAEGSEDLTIFVGTRWYMQIGSMSYDSPSDGDMTGTIELSNAGILYPVDYTKEQGKTLVDIIAEIYPATPETVSTQKTVSAKAVV